jgi:hypothetical protein
VSDTPIGGNNGGFHGEPDSFNSQKLKDRRTRPEDPKKNSSEKDGRGASSPIEYNPNPEF